MLLVLCGLRAMQVMYLAKFIAFKFVLLMSGVGNGSAESGSNSWAQWRIW